MSSVSAKGEPGRIGHDDVAERIHPAASGLAGNLLKLVRDQHDGGGGRPTCSCAR